MSGPKQQPLADEIISLTIFQTIVITETLVTNICPQEKKSFWYKNITLAQLLYQNGIFQLHNLSQDKNLYIIWSVGQDKIFLWFSCFEREQTKINKPEFSHPNVLLWPVGLLLFGIFRFFKAFNFAMRINLAMRTTFNIAFLCKHGFLFCFKAKWWKKILAAMRSLITTGSVFVIICCNTSIL